ncbi:hypothetical protein [Streptomyces flavidovirens]|uniref:Transposase n=1 Tax=Streptomyces flavidovirens TaxID=67298 RepID=A0ABW6R881_9ACTN
MIPTPGLSCRTDVSRVTGRTPPPEGAPPSEPEHGDPRRSPGGARITPKRRTVPVRPLHGKVVIDEGFSWQTPPDDPDWRVCRRD